LKRRTTRIVALARIGSDLGPRPSRIARDERQAGARNTRIGQ